MSEESESSRKFGVAVIGPTGIGKTSIIATMLEEGQKALAGTPASLRARGETAKRVNRLNADLRGALFAGEFSTGGLKGTESKVEYELDLTVESASLELRVLDFPGRWFDSARRGPQHEALWTECSDFIQRSSILLVPVDATLVMEAVRKPHAKALVDMLCMEDTHGVAYDWAKGRFARPDEPAALILVPVKCEKYFDDNGGAGTRSDELFDRVMNPNLYGQTIKTVHEACSRARVLYAPVDTYGCVALTKTTWHENADAPGGFDVKSHYDATANVLRRLGAAPILTTICEQLSSALASEAAVEAAAHKSIWDAAQQRARPSPGFFGGIKDFFSKSKRQARRDEKSSGVAAADAAKHHSALVEAVGKIAKIPMPDRTRFIHR
ncbi:MAG: hypothetical protein ACHREM_10665 [Polyangiales bacterium]